jgi:hypothetical protein
MTTADPPTLDQALALARRLSARERARLIAALAAELAEPPHGESALANNAWANFQRLRDELAALPARRLASEQLEADRAERQVTLEGRGRAHP